MLVQSPTYVLMNTSRITGDNLKTSDYIFAGIMLAAVATSAVADQQQWSNIAPITLDRRIKADSAQTIKLPNIITRTPAK